MGNLCAQMGSAASVDRVDKKYIQEQEEKNKQIDKDLLNEKRKKVLKLLLLGNRSLSVHPLIYVFRTGRVWEKYNA